MLGTNQSTLLSEHGAIGLHRILHSYREVCMAVPVESLRRTVPDNASISGMRPSRLAGQSISSSTSSPSFKLISAVKKTPELLML
jgi:hypothetical protein